MSLKNRSLQSNFLQTLVFVFSLSQVAVAQLNTQANDRTSLDKIAELLLGKWVGEVTAEDGGKVITELTFEWTLHNKFLKVTSMVAANGQKSLFAETVYGWQPVLNQVVFWSFDNAGTISEGHASLEGNVLKHEWRAFASNGQIRDLRSSFSRLSNDSAIFTLMEGKGAATSVRYRRVKE